MFQKYENSINHYAPFAARILLSLLFLFSAFGKLTNFSGTQQFMESIGFPAAAFFLVVSIIIEIGGSLSLVLGYKAKHGAYALIIYTLVASVVFHSDFSNQLNALAFLRNLGIIGGFLYVIVYGTGALSLDNKRTTQSLTTD